jgi:hypothetical protein
MTAKNKARELVKKFRLYAFTSDYDYAENGAQNEYYNAEKCAIIAVDEIIKSMPKQPSISITMCHFEATVYWEEVKKEIEKL